MDNTKRALGRNLSSNARENSYSWVYVTIFSSAPKYFQTFGRQMTFVHSTPINFENTWVSHNFSCSTPKISKSSGCHTTFLALRPKFQNHLGVMHHFLLYAQNPKISWVSHNTILLYTHFHAGKSYYKNNSPHIKENDYILRKANTIHHCYFFCFVCKVCFCHDVCCKCIFSWNYRIFYKCYVTKYCCHFFF